MHAGAHVHVHTNRHHRPHHRPTRTPAQKGNPARPHSHSHAPALTLALALAGQLQVRIQLISLRSVANSMTATENPTVHGAPAAKWPTTFLASSMFKPKLPLCCASFVILVNSPLVNLQWFEQESCHSCQHLCHLSECTNLFGMTSPTSLSTRFISSVYRFANQRPFFRLSKQQALFEPPTLRSPARSRRAHAPATRAHCPNLRSPWGYRSGRVDGVAARDSDGPVRRGRRA